uniref:Uncharacterized protein n=1 Tax=Anguilla anguilla TaxID=7936 RepID=A0A0E9TJB8_ANGAN
MRRSDPRSPLQAISPAPPVDVSFPGIECDLPQNVS